MGVIPRTSVKRGTGGKREGEERERRPPIHIPGCATDGSLSRTLAFDRGLDKTALKKSMPRRDRTTLT